MGSETFTTAMFLIAAIIASAVLINAAFPVIYTMSGTFSSSAKEADERIRTDIKIINTYATTGGEAQIWIKNVGKSRISLAEVSGSDMFIGAPGDFERVSKGSWSAEILEDANENWEYGETLLLTVRSAKIPDSIGRTVYFQFILPNGVMRSTEFTVGG
ncbi:MAG: flagellin [Methanomicrobiales archaeon]|nr:flagellin [Methanomicrobiales archaeon]